MFLITLKRAQKICQVEKCDKIATGNKKCYFYCTRPNSISKIKGFNKNELDYIKNTEEMLRYLKNEYLLL